MPCFATRSLGHRALLFNLLISHNSSIEIIPLRTYLIAYCQPNDEEVESLRAVSSQQSAVAPSAVNIPGNW